MLALPRRDAGGLPDLRQRRHTDLLWENNIFGPSSGQGYSNVPVENGHLVQTDDTQYESENFVVRNILFVGLKWAGAFTFAGPKVSWLYNNVFYQNGDVECALIELSKNPPLAGGLTLKTFSFNNIFFLNGPRPICRVRDPESGQNLYYDYNLYETGADGGDLSIADEANSLEANNPLLASRAMPQIDPLGGTDQNGQILTGFKTTTGSPAHSTGISPWDLLRQIHSSAIAAMSDRKDACGSLRPFSGSWDMGLCQAVSTATDGGGGMTNAGTTDARTGAPDGKVVSDGNSCPGLDTGAEADGQDGCGDCALHDIRR